MAQDTKEFKGEMDDLKRDFDTLRADFSKLAQHLTQRAQERFSDSASVAGRLAQDARERAQELARDAHAQIEERPGATAALAFGVGLALGLLLTRGRR
jgi:ElaB/YqjD/DUF883 family membrane-anchored ribosome-binding protein